MAERVPPPRNGKDEYSEQRPNESARMEPTASSSTSRALVPSSQEFVPHNQSQYTTFRAGTYVVQVPKDQIYRIPPPENASIVQRHRDPSKKKKPMCCNFICLGILFFFLLFIILLITGLYVSVILSKDPKFSVQRLVYNNKTRSNRPDYTITLQSQNRNSQAAVLYKNGGDASLNLKTQEIATGSYPSFEQDSGKSKEFAVIFHGSKIKLPTDIQKSSTTQKPQVHVKFSLSMDIPGRMRRGALKRSMTFHVECDFTVDTLVKGTRVLNQECQTNRK
ncbi:NDR1/HIN1-like protein 13 [Argentina anserina]|uniref:NDR1/HIN1-like protein 13 n=1 Tax=Argentina anserina TaxID=57926 RepID=UPI00217671A4|nr:NDR1/HIN1-like protein 13 [Potentilla anserina]